jgi:hypothetical protein
VKTIKSIIWYGLPNMKFDCCSKKRMTIKILNSAGLFCILFSHIATASQPITDYLLKPTGQYNVAFKEIHWVNNTICPDPNYSKANQKNFSSGNKKYCHELMIRVYYPTTFNPHAGGSPYYRPLVSVEQNILKTIPGMKQEDVEQLGQLKSHTIENAPVVKRKKFPVILFISGLGGQTQLYENTITQLVSHGYIVVGINSVFINGDILLPNNTVASTTEVQKWDVVSKTTLPVLEQDISFVYKKIHEPAQDPVFKSMDLKHIGALGHSFGGRAVANVVNQHEGWFQALLTFDMEVHMGSYQPKNSMIPSMHIISAYWRSAFNWLPLQYHLGKNGYLVTLSPSDDNKHYSYHMNFTDLSTLQYLPAYQAAMKYNHSRLAKSEDVVIKTSLEPDDKLSDVKRPLYLIEKRANVWNLVYYEPGKKATKIDLEMIPGLQMAVDQLPLTPLTESKLIPIKKMIHAYHQGFGNNLGTGNGYQINKALNLYVVDFFNVFLKNEKNPFLGCTALTNNTRMGCGPGIF